MYPLHPLLESLDLEREGLEQVKRASDELDISRALTEVVAHFRRRKEPDPSLLARADEGAIAAADRAMRREFVFYNEPGTVPPSEWDWTYKPGADWEWVYALNRHVFWTSLASAYLATKDERYARELDMLVKSWVGGHPPSVDDLSAWRTLEAAIRMYGSWPSALGAMKASPSITRNAWLYYLRSIHDHAEHLLAYPKTNNWLLAESNGLLTCGLLFPEFKRADLWARTALERFEGEMMRSVHPDGAHIEYSSGYHFYSLSSFTSAMDRADRAPGPKVSQAYRERIVTMWEYGMYLMRPDGHLPMLNDGETNHLAPGLAAAGRRYGRPDFIYAATNGAEGTPPRDTSHRFPWVRRAVMRSGWDRDALYAMLEAAPLGAGHVHEDALTFEIMAYGQPLIGTMGRYTYVHVPKRLYLVNSRGHNTVTIDGQEQLMKKTHPDRSEWVATGETNFPWTSTPELDVAYSRYDGPWTGDLAGVVWERRMAFHRPAGTSGRLGFWIIRDAFHGDGEHELRFLLHFFPGEIACDEGEGVVRSDYGPDRGNVVVRFVDPAGLALDCAKGQEEPPRGWYSPVYGKIEPAWEVAAVRRAAFPAEFVMVLVPFRGEEAPQVEATLANGTVRVTIDGRTWPVTF